MTSDIKVLDHGYVRFIGSMGTDETIIDAARMSTDGGFVSWEPYAWHPKGDLGLLAYLYRNQHMTPFEMCELAVEVQAPIFVAREWMRSRTQSYNEMSARYVQMPDLHYLPPPERFVKQSTSNKQGGAEPFHAALGAGMHAGLESEQRSIYAGYSWLVEQGLAREVARINTPVSRYTRFRAKTDLRNWLGFLNLRLRENAQEEIRVYAQAVAGLVQELWPRTWALFEEYDLHGKRLSRTEYAEYLRLKEGK